VKAPSSYASNQMKDISKLGLNFQKPLIMDFYNNVNNSSIDYSSKYANN